MVAAAAAAAAKSRQSCPTLCDPMDGSPSGFPIPGILQARTLEWVAISFSRGSSQPMDPLLHCWQVESLPLGQLGSPAKYLYLEHALLSHLIE